MWWPVPAQWLGMCTLVALLLLLTMSPTISLWVARIRPPYFGSITGRDLFRRSAGLPVDAVSPVDEGADEEANTDTTPRGAQIAVAAVRANNILTGNLCGCRADAARRGVGHPDAGPPPEHGGRGAGRAVRGDLHQPRARVRRQASGRRAGVRCRGRDVRRCRQIRCARTGFVRAIRCCGARWSWPGSVAPACWRRYWCPSPGSRRWCG